MNDIERIELTEVDLLRAQVDILTEQLQSAQNLAARNLAAANYMGKLLRDSKAPAADA